MRDQQVIRGFEEHDRVINELHQRFREVERGADKVYLQNLTHVMMWDVLLSLLGERGIITQEQFDQALSALSEKTRLAFEAEQQKKKQAAVEPATHSD